MSARGRATGQYRAHAPAARRKAMLIRFTVEEFAVLAEAAGSAGLTPTGYAAEAALAAARGVEAPSVHPWRAVLVELMAARSQVRRFGTNVNQAVRALNATGEPPEWLAQAVAITDRAVARLDAATDAVAATAARPRPRHSPSNEGRSR